MSMKNPPTTAGIEPATFRFVAQHLNHCATAVPVDKEDSVEFCYGRAVARAVSRWALGAEDLVHRQDSPCEIGVIQTGNEKSFFCKYSLIHTITGAVQSLQVTSYKPLQPIKSSGLLNHFLPTISPNAPQRNTCN